MIVRNWTLFSAALGAALGSTCVFAQPPAPIASVRTPPPVFNPVPPAPMVIAQGRRAVGPIEPVEVVLMMGSTTLWSGALNIGGTMPARISLAEPTAIDGNCAAYNDFGRSGRRIELSISGALGERMQGYRLSASYSRPPSDDSCGAGSRTASIEQRFDWSSGKSQTFEGDGGLKVILTRR